MSVVQHRSRTWVISLARIAFGELRWSAPPWLRNKPRESAAAALAVLLLAIGGHAGWRWYQGRPKPIETTFTLIAPGLTCYSCEPVGPPQPLIVQFSDSAAPLDRVHKRLPKDSRAVRITPQVEGTWHWDDGHTLRFQPAADWPIGTSFDVRFERKGLLAPHVRLADYEGEFATPKFAAHIADTEFHQDPIMATHKKAVVNVRFTHPVDVKQFEKRISLHLYEHLTDTKEEERTAPAFTVIYDAPKLNAYIHSAQLDVPRKQGTLRIAIDSGLRAARGGNRTEAALETTVTVPGRYSLVVQQMSLEVVRDERERPSQVLMVAFNRSIGERELPPKFRAWRLPAKHPNEKLQAQFETHSRGKRFAWTPQTLNNDIVAASKPLALTQIGGELDHYETHSLRHEAQPGEYLLVRIDAGLESFGGYLLGQTVDQILRVPEYPKEMRIVHTGAVLALSGRKTVTVMTRDVPALRLEIGRLLPGQIQHLVTQTHDVFSGPGFKGEWAFGEENITERFEKTIRLPQRKPGEAHYEALPLESYLAKDTETGRGIFFLRVQGWDEAENQPLRMSGDARLIVVTDLGLLVKRSLDGSQDVFVQSVRTGEPLAGVLIEVLGRNGVAVISATTDATGHVRFADLRSFKREREPALYLARRGADTSFLPVAQAGRGLDLSRFDVGGVSNRIDEGTLSAYLFSDRGLYRPGEEIRIGAIVRNKDWSHSLQGVPLRLDVIDPRGVTVRSESFVPGPAGFAEIRHTTRESSAAGSYQILLSIVSAANRNALIGSLVVQVRDFLPDRLRMSARFSAQSVAGWVSPDELKAHVALQNLFGTPAEKRRVTASMTLSPAFPAFADFADYTFYDPQAARSAFGEELPDATTDEKGEATFSLDLKRFERATYRVHLAVEGFEADGGRGVSAEAAQLVSNMPYLIGWKADGDLGYVSHDAARSVQLIAIDPQVRPIEVQGLQLVRIETRALSTLIRLHNGTYQYQSRHKEVERARSALVVPQAGFNLPLAVDEPGSFSYVVEDRDGMRLARINYQVAGNANLTRTLEKDAQLQIVLSRKDYAPGQDIELQIQAPYTGAGLITIERERVYAWSWFRTSTTSSTQRIRLPEGIEGNAYVNVAFVRDPDSPEVYTSPLSYGVQPFSINLGARRHELSIEAPQLVKPGEMLRVKYSSKRATRIVLLAIDEGILQVAGYRTADPLGHFFQKRSLDVSTLQILDLILPEFQQGELGSAPGGDAQGALGKHLNPFRRKGDKPVAWWSGILDADATTREAEYEVPDYFNGTLRVMAVAVSDDAIGVYEGRSLVRGEFVISPNAPTTVTPGDEFEVSVGIANNLAGSGEKAQITLGVQPGAALQLIGEATQTLTIAESHEGSARLRMRALEKLGAATIEFSVRSGSATVRRRIDLSVRPATPAMTTISAGAFKRKSRDIPVQRTLFPERRSVTASVSLLPIGMARGLVIYLDNYPYLCTEQLVSRAVPALVLEEVPEFGNVRSPNGGADIDSLVGELRVRQAEDGAFRLWPGGSEVSEFASIYAQHFLVEAAERGRRVPAAMLQAGNGYLRMLARRDGNNLTQERHSAHAIYLLIRQGEVMSAEAAALRKRLTDRYEKEWQQDLAAVWLAASFKLMRQEDEAQRTLRQIRFAAGEPTDIYSDAMTRDGFLLYVLALHFPERLPQLPREALENLVAQLTAGRYHSLSAGSTLLGLSAYSKVTGADSKVSLGAAELLRDKTARVLSLDKGLVRTGPVSEAAAAVRFSEETDLNAYYVLEETGFDRNVPKTALSKGFEIIREFTDDAGKPVSQVKMGDQINVHIKLRALNRQLITDIAVVDLLPGGFDLVNGSGRGGLCDYCASASRWLRFADSREDRVVFYTAVGNEVDEIVYRIKATNVGAFVVPPAYGEAMYDRSVVARSVAARLEVVWP